MTSIQTVGVIVAKGFKLVLNLALIIIYARGNQGDFLGVGGSWNLNEHKTADLEIIAAGIFVGFFIYTAVVLISYCFGTLEHKKTLVELIMNFVGFFMYIIIGGVAMHYWVGYMGEHKQLHTPTEKVYGIILGFLCILSGLVYLLDLVLTGLHYIKYQYY